MKDEENKKNNRLLNILKKIFIIITSPIWFPWKVLFVRKESKKFKNVSTSKKVFRILRSPITKPLKLMIFFIIVGIEIVCVYKIRYSPVTYTFTRMSVHNYYLKGETNNKLIGITRVNASSINEYADELKIAFEYIDKWDLDSKNKMYVLLDADITKIGFKFMDKKNIEYILNRFNTDSNFREDIRYIAKNVNKIISRAVREFPEQVPYAHDFDIILVPVTNAVSVAVDYRAILDIFGTVANTIINFENVDINESFEMSNEDIDLSLEMIIKFSKGFSIKESYDSVNEKYLNTNSYSNSVVNIQN